MRLSIVTQFYPPDYAATGQLIEELARHLITKGIDVQVFAGQPGYAYDQPFAPAYEIQEGIQIRRTRTSRIWPKRIRGRAIGGLLYCLRALVKLRRPVRQGDLFLVTTEPPYLLLIAYLLHLFYRRPYICLVYDLYPEVAVILGVLPAKHWLVRVWKWLNHLTWRQAQAIIVLSSTMKERILRQCPELEPRITIIHNWANADQIRPLAKSANWFAQQYGLDQVFTVLYSGNLGRCHDLATIMTAAYQLRHDPVKFIFIGGGAKLPMCKQFAEKHGLLNCLFLPFQAKETLPYSLTACDLSLVSLEKGMEGIVAPSKFYGCLAAGRPIAAICEPHSYLRDIIRTADCGKAIQNGDAPGLANFIGELMANPNEVNRLGNNSRAYLQQHYTLDHIAQEYYDLIVSCKS